MTAGFLFTHIMITVVQILDNMKHFPGSKNDDNGVAYETKIWKWRLLPTNIISREISVFSHYSSPHLRLLPVAINKVVVYNYRDYTSSWGGREHSLQSWVLGTAVFPKTYAMVNGLCVRDRPSVRPSVCLSVSRNCSSARQLIIRRS